MSPRSKLLRAAVLAFSLLLAAFGVWFSQTRASADQALMPSSKVKVFRDHSLPSPATP